MSSVIDIYEDEIKIHLAKIKELEEELRLHEARHIFGKGNHHLKQVARDGLIEMVERRTQTIKKKGAEIQELENTIKAMVTLERLAEEEIRVYYFEKALEDIRKHIEISMKGRHDFSAVWCLANAALTDGTDR